MIRLKHIIILIGVILLILGNISAGSVLFNGTNSEFNDYLNSNVLNLLSYVSFILTGIVLTFGIILLIVIYWDTPINLKKLIKR